jgi:hypothetical protein
MHRLEPPNECIVERRRARFRVTTSAALRACTIRASTPAVLTRQ